MKDACRYFWRLLLVWLLGSQVMPAFAQSEKISVVISEVLLDKANPGQSWVELYNPTDSQIVVKAFRLSHVKTLSILPPEVNKLGGISLLPGEYVVLCADKQQFVRSYGSMTNCIEVPVLKFLANGGFIAAITEPGRGTSAGLVRYGEAKGSSRIAEIAGNQILGYSNTGKSYARKVANSSSQYQISPFTEESPTPGRANH